MQFIQENFDTLDRTDASIYADPQVTREISQAPQEYLAVHFEHVLCLANDSVEKVCEPFNPFPAFTDSAQSCIVVFPYRFKLVVHQGACDERGLLGVEKEGFPVPQAFPSILGGGETYFASFSVHPPCPIQFWDVRNSPGVASSPRTPPMSIACISRIKRRESGISFDFWREWRGVESFVAPSIVIFQIPDVGLFGMMETRTLVISIISIIWR